MSLLPSSRSDSESAQDGSLRILDVGDDEADAVFDALSSQTTRTILAELHRTQRTPAELADQTDTTIQNAMAAVTLRVFTEEVGAMAANATIDQAFDQRLW